jgi:two-component sensor histidine kinase
LLAREAEHRTKNILAAVQAVVNVSHSTTVAGLKQAIQGRIRALASLQNLFGASHWTGAEISDIAAGELAPYREGGEARVRIDGPSLLLPPDAAQAIGMALHELSTNAAKYGSLSAPSGKVDLTWRKEDERLFLRWSESGGPPAEKPTHQGFGTTVLNRIIREQLGGEIRFDWLAAGLACKIVIRV